jgi:putative transposase
VKAKLTLAERTFTCEVCGRQLDRDLNAAHNLANLHSMSPEVVGRHKTLVEPAVSPSLLGGWP